MKIIFLDIDGVLCSFRSHYAQGKPLIDGCMSALDREGVGLLNVLAGLGTDTIKYVLSSTWRKHHDQGWMENHLRNHGWTGEFHEDWRTTIEHVEHNGIIFGVTRGREIQEWLNRHPEITEYVIIDDDSDMLDEQLPRFAQTHTEDGISFSAFQKARRILFGS